MSSIGKKAVDGGSSRLQSAKIYTDFYGALLKVQSSEKLRALLVALDEKIESTFEYLTVPTTTHYK